MPLQAAGRWSGALHLGAGYDDSVLQDASSLGSFVSEDAFDLSYRGRAWRDLSGHLTFHGAAVIQPNFPNQDLDQASADARLAWRFFDAFSPLLEGSAQQISGLRSSALDSTAFAAGSGLRVDLWSLGMIEALAQGAHNNYPHSDLDSDDLGAELRLDADLFFGKLSARYQSTTRNFSERKNYLNRLAFAGTDARQDQIQTWNFSLQGDATDSYSEAWVRGSSLSSNGDSIDFGPGQNQYNDLPPTFISAGNFFSDNSLSKDYFSRSTIGSGYTAWWQWHPWRLQGRIAWDEIIFSNRLAKGFDEKFRPGNPVRRDRVTVESLSVDYQWSLWRQDWDLALLWQHDDSSSNDLPYNYQRNLTQLDLGLYF